MGGNMTNKINICHISDLHFGVYENKSFCTEDESFSLAYSLIEFISNQFDENQKPHFLIISGDLTSVSDKDEYSQFLQFMDHFIEEDCFAKCCFKKYKAIDRTIIVPGNHDTVRKVNPKIIYCAISGYGQTGPLVKYVGHDANYLSYAGVLDIIGEADRPPSIPGIQIADIAGGGMNAVIGILLISKWGGIKKD